MSVAAEACRGHCRFACSTEFKKDCPKGFSSQYAFVRVVVVSFGEILRMLREEIRRDCERSILHHQQECRTNVGGAARSHLESSFVVRDFRDCLAYDTRTRFDVDDSFGETPAISKAESGGTMRTGFLRFDGAVARDPAIDAWMKLRPGELAAIARQWFEVMRECGDEVRELVHDGCPVACLGDAPFGYVNVFTSHVNVGFFHGAALPDPARMLQGNGKFMRHVKLRPGTAPNAAALSRLIEAAYSDIKARVENG